MLNARNIKDILHQSLRSVSTTRHSVLATSITLSNGSLLSSVINEDIPINPVTETEVKIYSLFAQRQGIKSGEIVKFDIVVPEEDDDEYEEDESFADEQLQLQRKVQRTARKRSTEQKQDEGLKLFVSKIPNTEYLVVLFTEAKYPEGIVQLKVKSLLENLQELEVFNEYD